MNFRRRLNLEKKFNEWKERFHHPEDKYGRRYVPKDSIEWYNYLRAKKQTVQQEATQNALIVPNTIGYKRKSPLTDDEQALIIRPTIDEFDHILAELDQAIDEAEETAFQSSSTDSNKIKRICTSNSSDKLFDINLSCTSIISNQSMHAYSRTKAFNTNCWSRFTQSIILGKDLVQSGDINNLLSYNHRGLGSLLSIPYDGLPRTILIIVEKRFYNDQIILMTVPNFESERNDWDYFQLNKQVGARGTILENENVSLRGIHMYRPSFSDDDILSGCGAIKKDKAFLKFDYLYFDTPMPIFNYFSEDNIVQIPNLYLFCSSKQLIN